MSLVECLVVEELVGVALVEAEGAVVGLLKVQVASQDAGQFDGHFEGRQEVGPEHGSNCRGQDFLGCF